jgi:hypothetical protein
MATQTFNTRAELQQYLAQNPNIRGTITQGDRTFAIPTQAPQKKQRNFVEGLIGGFTDPFVGLAKKAGEAFVAGGNNRFGEFASGSDTYKPTFMDDYEWQKFKKNGLLDTAKDVVGVGVNFIPGGAAAKGIGGLVKAGAIAGLGSGFANSEATDLGGLINDSLTGGATGGVVGGGLGVAGKALGGLIGKGAKGNLASGVANKLNEFADGRDLNVFKRAVGANAPQKLGGAVLEKESMNLANKMGVKINNADDLAKFSQGVLDEFGGKISQAADQATQKGLKVDINDIIKPLQEKLNTQKLLPEMKAPIEDVISNLKQSAQGKLEAPVAAISKNRGFTVANPTTQVTPAEAYKIKQQVGELGKFNLFVDPANSAKAAVYQDVYGGLSNQLKSTLGEAGFNSYDQTNKLVETALKGNKWADVATGKVRPTASLDDMARDAGSFAGLASGNPVMAIPGAIGGKILQSPVTEKALAGGARGLSGLISNGAKLGNGLPGKIGGLISEVKPRDLAKFGGIAGGAMQGDSSVPASADNSMGGFDAFLGEDPSMMDNSEAQSSQYTPEEQWQIRQTLIQLMSPVKQGGMGLSPTEAQKYMEMAYGINLGGGESAGVTKTKKTESEKKFSAAGQQAMGALNLLESGQAETGKIANAKNKIGSFFGSQNAGQTDYLSQLAAARGSAVSGLSGANVPPSEYNRIADMIPENTDEPEIAKQKLKSFVKAMQVYSSQ